MNEFEHVAVVSGRALRVRKTVIAVAASTLLALPATAAIVSTGLVNPDPSGGTVNGFLTVGTSGVGSLNVNGGSTLNAQRIEAGNQVGANGSITVTGAGSTINTNFGVVGSFYNANIGLRGQGSVSVLDGGTFNAGDSSATCKTSCRLHISLSAGSTGAVTVSGTGSTLNTLGGVRVGFAGIYTQAANGFTGGIAGGTSTGTLQVAAGGTVNSSFLDVGYKDLGSQVTDAESSTGTVTISGPGSSLNLTRNDAQTSGRSLLLMSGFSTTTSSLTVSDGALMKLDGSSAPTQFSGINMGNGTTATNTPNSQSTLTVTGAGSRILFDGGMGFFNIGNSVGATATVNVLLGATVGGVTGASPDTGLPFTSVGRGGGTGTLNVSGTGSTFALNGRNPNTDGGAFLNIGRTESGVAGTGTVNITSGGRVSVDTMGLVLTNPSGQSGMFVGIGAGSTGTLNISGAGSRMDITGDTGLTPYVGVGRDGATGTMTISGGGRFEMSSQHVSAVEPAGATGYSPGQGLFFEIGRNVASAAGASSTGIVTVTGAGSELMQSGIADRVIQLANGAGTTGTLNILNGGKVTTGTVVIANNGGTGTLNMSAGSLVLDGTRNGGPNPGIGAFMLVGRAEATGFANLSNGSTINMSIAGTTGGITVGGGGAVPGGSGTMLLSGGSTVNITGANGGFAVGGPTPAGITTLGTVVLSGAGTAITVNGANTRVIVGNGVNSTGTLVIGAGTSVSTSGIIGVAHDGTAATGGAGTMIVNGTANATTVYNGASGLIGGNGRINANVINQGGTIAPGLSPGTLTINGSFDNNGGKIVLEVQDLGNGQFDVDKLIFTDIDQVLMDGGVIEFSFLGATNPLDFLASGQFELSTFIKEVDAGGNVVDLADANLDIFVNSLFAAQAERYAVGNFSFTPGGNVSLTATAIPLPATLALALLALGAMGAARQPGRRVGDLGRLRAAAA